MAEVLEKPGTRVETDQIEKQYLVAGTTDEAEAFADLAAETPLTLLGLPRTSVEVIESAEGFWDGVVTWGINERGENDGETGEIEVSFDTTGGQQHITHSKQTINGYTNLPTMPDFEGAIGVTDDAVEGVDITIPVFTFVIRAWIDGSAFTIGYQNAIADLTGKTNNAPFYGREAGEVLFLGGSGIQRGRGDVEMTFRFAVSQHATGLTVGPITGIDKNGWDYLWVLYQRQAGADVIGRVPIAVYVERVYDDGDFSVLGVGSGS